MTSNSESADRRHRDPDATRARLIDAVGTVLARDGFSRLGVNAVARHAGVDKVLIYRYFGGMDELLQAFAASRAFWPSFEELTDDDPEALRRRPLAEQVSTVLRNFAHALRRRPLTLEILAWETVEHNEFTELLERVRDELTSRLLGELSDEASRRAGIDVVAVTALLAAGVNYLLVRARTVPAFSGVELATDAGWARLEHAIDAVCRSCFAGGAR